MQMDPDRLLILRSVAEAGGVVAAASRLRLAPSGVSQHLAALEREVGLALVDRSRRGGQRTIVLTAAGRRLAGHGARLAAVLDDARTDVLSLIGELRGRAALGIFPSALRQLALPALRTLTDEHPGVQPQVRELNEDPAIQALHAGHLDVALVEADSGGPIRRRAGLATTRLLDDPYRLAVPADWPVPTALEDLAHRPWIEGPPASAAAQVLNRLRGTSGLPLRGEHYILEFPAVLALVEAGIGAALVPDLALSDQPAAAVRIVDLPGLGSRAISAVHVAGRRPPPVVTALVVALESAGRAAAG